MASGCARAAVSTSTEHESASERGELLRVADDVVKGVLAKEFDIAIRQGGRRPPCRHVHRLLCDKAVKLDRKLRDPIEVRRRIRRGTSPEDTPKALHHGSETPESDGVTEGDSPLPNSLADDLSQSKGHADHVTRLPLGQGR
jgi:hypothetical protein